MTLGAQIALSAALVFFVNCSLGAVCLWLGFKPSDNMYALSGLVFIASAIVFVVGLFMMVWA